MNIYIFDCEVFRYDWLFIFKKPGEPEYTVIHNDAEAVKAFMEQSPVLCGFNNKHYDQFILKAVLCDMVPEEIKRVNDQIIVQGMNGWEIPDLRDCGIYFEQFDLMDDCQQGLSLKAIEGHLGMNIRESEVSFDIDHPLSAAELEDTIFYCKYDVAATEKLYELRQGYLDNKKTLGMEKGLTEEKALYMTNAKLTAAYLEARAVAHEDERDYDYPATLLKEYIPQEVFDFFDKLHDLSIPDEEIFSSKYIFKIGDCEVTLGYGGIHGAIAPYAERATATRTIRNKDVASYYPHQMILNRYCSRNIPTPDIFAAMVERRVAAKKAGDKKTANALKLVANTTYGAMLNQYNDLYDPLMGRSVCISGQLQLLELSLHLVQECPTLKIIQLNTDGIMVSIDNADVGTYEAITEEWQQRTGFELEEDLIDGIIQKDVNNYVEIPQGAADPKDLKTKGGVLVRGIVTNGKLDFAAMGLPAWDNLNGGAFNVNNNAVVVARAVRDCLAFGKPVEQTITECDTILDFQFVAKASSKYGQVVHMIGETGECVQKCNRVYATADRNYGTLYKTHLETGSLIKMAGLPEHCIVDNSNDYSIAIVDKAWYIRLAKRYVNDFLGVKPPKKNTRRINSLKKKSLALLEA